MAGLTGADRGLRLDVRTKVRTEMKTAAKTAVRAGSYSIAGSGRGRRSLPVAT